MLSEMQRGFLQLLPDGPLVQLTGDTTIGRRTKAGPAAVFQVDSSRLGRLHSMVAIRDGRYWLSDLESSSGTWLTRAGERRRITAETELRDGDVIGLEPDLVRFTLQ